MLALLQALQQLLVMVAAGAVLALSLQPVLRPKAASVLAVPEEGLVVQLQVTQGLALFLWLQGAELWAAGRLSTCTQAQPRSPPLPWVARGAGLP